MILPKVTREEAGYCSFLVDVDKTEPNEKVSKKTKRKVYATKAYMCQYQKDMWNYLYHRELRYVYLILILISSNQGFY